MPKRKPDPKAAKTDAKPRARERVEDLPVKSEQAAAVKGGAKKRDGVEHQHNETLVRA